MIDFDIMDYSTYFLRSWGHDLVLWMVLFVIIYRWNFHGYMIIIFYAYINIMLMMYGT